MCSVQGEGSYCSYCCCPKSKLSRELAGLLARAVEVHIPGGVGKAQACASALRNKRGSIEVPLL